MFDVSLGVLWKRHDALTRRHVTAMTNEYERVRATQMAHQPSNVVLNRHMTKDYNREIVVRSLCTRVWLALLGLLVGLLV